MDRMRLPTIVAKLKKKRSIVAHGPNADSLPATPLNVATATPSPRDSLSPQKTTSILAALDKPLPKRLPELPQDTARADSYYSAATDGAGTSVEQPRVVVRQESHEAEVVSGGNDNEPSTCSHVVPELDSTRFPVVKRTRRPPSLHLAPTRTCGFTEAPLVDLKQSIAARAQGSADIVEQFARPKPPKKRKTQDPNFPPTMGNHASTLAQEDCSDEDVSRNPVRVLRKSSTLLFNKRVDSRSPLPRPATATTMIVTEVAPGCPSLYGDAHNNTDDANIRRTPAHRARTPPAATNSSSRLSGSDVSFEISSPTGTIKNTSQSHAGHVNNDDETLRHNGSTPTRLNTLSPTIPDIPALPEDTPHKYGLLDRTGTPVFTSPHPMPDEAPGLTAARRSSGVELFREATSLASASSFLNGLSVSRRAADSSDSWIHVPSRSQSRPRSRPHSSGASRPSSAVQNPVSDLPDRRGHDLFKRNRFAYSRPLTLAQLRCFRGHAKLMASRNKSSPVECAICHMDDDQEHFSCSWCAVRMCRYCQIDFSKRGMAALNERIKKAEMGNISDDSSLEEAKLEGPVDS